MKPNSTKMLFKANPLFAGISDKELEDIIELAEECSFHAQEFIIHEEEMLGTEFYLIQSGKVEILKKPSEDTNDAAYCITTLSAGETIGEIALLDNMPRTASARALTETIVLRIPIKKLKERTSHQAHYEKLSQELQKLQATLSEPPSYAKMALNLSKELSKRLSDTNAITAEALKEELKLSQMQIESGRFLFLIISILSLYTYCLSGMYSLTRILPSTTLILVPMILIFSAITIHFMLNSRYSLSFYGFTMKNWRKASIEGLFLSIPLMIIIVLAKWLYIHFSSIDIPLFEGPAGAFQSTNPILIASLVVAYLITAPVQEIIVRGALQSSLEQFLIGKHRIASSIIISNLIFGMAHLYISLSTGIIVIAFGLAWGWLYAHQKSLVGVSLSHLIVGSWGFFVVGIDKLLLSF